MGALNAPKISEQKEIPDQAKGNPVYEQTRQDMPLWCCGTNCGRNSRITVFVLGIIGICSSSIVCLSPHYFRFVSLRNDTFYEEEKFQPQPFRYATEANVGLFRYEILEVFEYPWPPQEQRELFDAMHYRELERLAKSDGTQNSGEGTSSGSSSFDIFNRLLQKKFPDGFYDDDDDYSVSEKVDENDDQFSTSSENSTTHQNDTMDIVLTRAPADAPLDTDEIPVDEVPDVGPGSNAKERFPTSTPTSSPTVTNPNDLIDVEINKVLSYPPGSELDKLFKNGQMGAMWAPILATIGLIFAAIEFFCCIYKCSWLPTAIFLYIAFMMQLMTMFLFMSEDFCDYTQDCWLGSAGFVSVIAVVCYLVCQTLVCMTPRPPPKYNLLKKPPVRRKKKKKKKRGEFDEDETESGAGTGDRFADESSFASSSRYLDSYDDSHYGGSYNDDYNDGYNDGFDNDFNNGYDNDYNSGYDDSPYGVPDSSYNDSYDHDGYNNGYDGGSYDNDQRSYDDNTRGSYDSGKDDGNDKDAPSSSRRRKKK